MDRNPPELRVMVDANILIAGVVWPRWPFEGLQHAIHGDFQLVLSGYILQQAHRRIRARFPDYLHLFDDFLLYCRYELVKEPTREEIVKHSDLLRDPTDIPVALAAIHAGVDYLVSEDKDLTAQDKSTARLRQSLKIMISGTFLREVMGWKSEDLERIRRRNWQDIKDLDE